MLRGQVDVKALNIHRQVDVKLNELAKQILLMLPLLLLMLLLLYVLYHVLIQGGEAPLYNHAYSTYSRSSIRGSRGSSSKICFANSFSLTSTCLWMLRGTKKLNDQIVEGTEVHFKLNVNSNENENKNTTGEDTCAGALRAPRAGSPACVFVFVFV